jgi:hypothetical protein
MTTKNAELKGRTIAILATDGFEQAELTEPKRCLEKAGARVDVLSIHEGKITGWDKTGWGSSVNVDVAVSDASPSDYDALVLPEPAFQPAHGLVLTMECLSAPVGGTGAARGMPRAAGGRRLDARGVVPASRRAQIAATPPESCRDRSHQTGQCYGQSRIYQ